MNYTQQWNVAAHPLDAAPIRAEWQGPFYYAIANLIKLPLFIKDS